MGTQLSALHVLLGTLVVYFALITDAHAEKEHAWQDYKAQASVAYRSGNVEKAVLLAQLAYESSRLDLGESHQDTLQNLVDLAFLYHTNKQYDEAQVGYSKVLDIRRRTLGPAHPETIGSINNIAVLYYDMGMLARKHAPRA